MRTVNNIGDYDRRFRFEKKNIAINPVGNAQTEVWETVTTLWGKFQSIPSQEKFEAQQQVASQQAQIKTRFRDGIDETMRFVDVIYGGVYQISNVMADKREDYLIIKAQKRDNQ